MLGQTAQKLLRAGAGPDPLHRCGGLPARDDDLAGAAAAFQAQEIVPGLGLARHVDGTIDSYVAKEQPWLDEIRGVAKTSRFDQGEPVAPAPAPHLGEHGEQILRELGYDDARIAALVAGAATAP